MEGSSQSKKHPFRYGEILMLIKNEENLDDYISGWTSEEIRNLRNFLEGEVDYLIKLKGDEYSSFSNIKSHYEPIANYYYKQDCKEQLESCTNETCYTSNPTCFNKKIYQQIEILRGLLEPLLKNE